MIATNIILWLTLCGLSSQLAAVATADSPIDSCPLQVNKLSPSYLPQNYDLRLEPDLKTMKFTGQVGITVQYTGNFTGFTCEKAKKSFTNVIGEVCRRVFTCGPKGDDLCKRRILLNVGNLIRVNNVQVFDATPKELRIQENSPLGVENVCQDERNELLEVTLEDLPQVGQELRLELSFEGKIGSESRGFYRSQHVNLLDSSTYINANTHFLPADARSAFPCFDQPDMKATFKLTLVHHKDLESFSNAPLASSQLDGDKKVSKFQPTPKMSTYVFAFAVGNYDSTNCLAKARSRDIEVRAFAPIGRAHEAQFTLNTVCKAIPVIERYFNMDFPLDKLDLVVTRQMRDPARENWGLLIFTEEFLLTSDRDTTNVLRAEIAKLTVHVVLHHWWGNLMTTQWWDDQWLFDGFTIWKSHWVAAEIYPEFNYEFNYLLRLASPMLDAQAASRQVHAIKTYQDLDANQELALFDANTYNKAGALYQMMSTSILGENILRDSLVRLLGEHKYGSCTSEDFFSAVRRVSGLDVEPILSSWLDQPGIPHVFVRVVGNELELHQSRVEEEPTLEGAEQLWHIPVTIQFEDMATARKENMRLTFKTRTMRVKFPVWFDIYNANHWLKLNQNFNGFYRVAYDSYLLKRLRAPIEQELLSPTNRLNIIDDLRGLLKITSLTRVTVDEVKEYLTWFAKDSSGGVLSGLAMALNEVAQTRRSQREMQQFAFGLFGHSYEQFGFKVVEGQQHAELNGRQDALLALVNYDHEQAITEALGVFDASADYLEPFLRKPVYLAVIKRGTDEQFQQLVGRLTEQTKSAYERQILILGLAPYLADGSERKVSLLALTKQ